MIICNQQHFHEFQATNVSGVRGGKLMCETKRELKIARSEYKTQRTSDEPSEVAEPKTPRQRVPQHVAEIGPSEQNRGDGPYLKSEITVWNPIRNEYFKQLGLLASR